MKKLNLLALLAILFGVSLFISCGDDDEKKDGDNDGDIAAMVVGVWQFAGSNHPEEFDDCDYERRMELTADGIYKEYDKCLNRTINGIWRINDEGNFVLRTEELPIPIVFTIEEITDSKIAFGLTLLGSTTIQIYKRIG